MPSGPAAEPIPAIGYIRVSMKREEMISPETQQSAIEDWARRRGRVIVDWIPDLDMTGREFIKRRIKEAINRVVAGEAREIAVWKYSRFGRDRAGVALNLARLEKAGGALVSATEDVDARTATGKFTRGMLFEVAAFESDRAGETWHEAYEYRVREGLPPLGRPRFGYVRLGRVRDEEDPHRTRRETRRDTDDPVVERYVPDAEHDPVLAGMYEDYIRGDGGGTIAQGLNRQAIPNTRGRPWSGRTVLGVLDSGFGAGYLRLHDPSCRCGRPEKCRNRVWVPGRQDPVITEGQWQAYRQRRQDTLTIPPRHRNPVYPLSGLVGCGHCGAAMTGVRLSSTSRRPSAVQFRCGRHRHYKDCPGHPAVSLGVLMEAVRGEIAKIADDLDAAAEAEEVRITKAADARELAGRLGQELAAVDRKLTRLALRRAEDEEGILPDSAWEDAAAGLKQDRARLGRQLAAAARESAAVSSDPLPVITGVLRGWDTYPPGRLNQMLRLLIRRVVVWRTGEPERDARGHWLPQQVRVRVMPIWEPDDTPPANV